MVVLTDVAFKVYYFTNLLINCCPFTGGHSPEGVPAGVQRGPWTTAEPLCEASWLLLLWISDDNHRVPDQLVVEAVSLAENRSQHLGVAL